MSRILGLALAASLFVACADGDTTGTTDDPNTDTDTTDTGVDPIPTPFEVFDDADLTNAAAVQALTAASSPQIFGTVYLAGITGTSSSDPKCPMLVEDKAAGTETYTGGCTSKGGVTYSGTLVVTTIPKTEGGTLEFEEFGYATEEDCAGGGTVTQSQTFDGVLELDDMGAFVVDIAATVPDTDLDLCTSVPRDLQIDYAGAAVGIGGKDTQTWSGSGTYAVSDFGKVEAQTFSEILEGDCASEADSGTTLLRSGGDEVTITYDGAVDCDDNGTVTWSLNGTVQGELGGVACSNAGVGTTSGLLALAGLLLLRRRRED